MNLCFFTIYNSSANYCSSLPTRFDVFPMWVDFDNREPIMWSFCFGEAIFLRSAFLHCHVLHLWLGTRGKRALSMWCLVDRSKTVKPPLVVVPRMYLSQLSGFRSASWTAKERKTGLCINNICQKESSV